VVAFLAVPWPLDLAVVPLLAGWAVMLSALPARGDRQRQGRTLFLVALTALLLGSLAIGTIVFVVP
jgi:hypothetical protein